MSWLWLIPLVWVVCSYFAFGYLYAGFSSEYEGPAPVVQSFVLSLLGPFAFLLIYLQSWFGKRLYPWQGTRWKK